MNKKTSLITGLVNKKSSLIAGLVILALILVMAIVPSLFTSYDRKEMFDPWLAQSASHILGTNSLGYDVWTELVYGARETVLVGLSAGLLSLVLALLVGSLASEDGFIGSLFTGLINVFMLIPKLICLIVLAVFLGTSNLNLILIISCFSWAGSAKTIRAKLLDLKAMPFMESLKLQGFGKLHIAIYHSIPNLFNLLCSRLLLGINSCLMMESTLAFLGLGNLYYPGWGTMVNLAIQRGAVIRGAYASILCPGLAIALLALSLYLISTYIQKRREEI